MKNLVRLHLLALVLLLIISCNITTKAPIELKEISPWCILGFDSKNRNPEERISMLKEMGIKKYGFNKGKGDLSTMIEEFELASEQNIEITSIFLWLNSKRDSIGKLSQSNQEIFRKLTQVKQKPTIWVSLSDNFFEGKNQNEALELSIKTIKYIKMKADEVGCKLAIYNHKGWFGNPDNQLEILESLKDSSISMVYNFHHAHLYVNKFNELSKKIKPYLSYVNISGVKKEGPEILPIGEGDYEFQMIKSLLNQGYNGPWGILGHVKTEDVQKVLNRNIEGLKLFNSKYKENYSNRNVNNDTQN